MASSYLPANQGAALGLTPGDADLVTITTPSGAKFRVARKVAPQFQGFVNELSSSGYGIDPSQSGGYNYRTIAGSPKISQHGYGNAIDINWTANPRGGAAGGNLPANVGDIAAKYGLAWGGNWSNPDPMHFEASTLVGAPTDGADANMTPGEMLLKRAIQKNNPAIGTPDATTGAVATAAPATVGVTGMDRLKAALGSKAYDPQAISDYDTLSKQGQQIAGSSGNAIGAIGGSLVAALGGGLSGYEGGKKKAFDENLRQGLASSNDTIGIAKLLMSSPDKDQQAMGINLLAQQQKAALQHQASFGKSPMIGTDKNTGELVAIQYNDKGQAIRTVLPPNVALSEKLLQATGPTQDTFIGQNTQRPVLTVPKDVAGGAEQHEIGKKKGENIASKPEATLRIGNAFSDLDRLAAEAQAIKDSPGLSNNYGLTGMLWNRPGSEASDSWARLASLKSQIANTVLQRMREASKTGGAVGNVSDSEQILFQNNLAALDKAQSPEAVQSALQRIIDWSQGSKERVGRAYQETYGEPYQLGPGESPSATDQPSTAGYKVLKVH